MCTCTCPCTCTTCTTCTHAHAHMHTCTCACTCTCTQGHPHPYHSCTNASWTRCATLHETWEGTNCSITGEPNWVRRYVQAYAHACICTCGDVGGYQLLHHWRAQLGETIRASIRACMHMYVHACVYIFACTRTCIRMRTCTCRWARAALRACMHMYVHAYVHMQVGEGCAQRHMHVHMHPYTCTCR